MFTLHSSISTKKRLFAFYYSLPWIWKRSSSLWCGIVAATAAAAESFPKREKKHTFNLVIIPCLLSQGTGCYIRQQPPLTYFSNRPPVSYTHPISYHRPINQSFYDQKKYLFGFAVSWYRFLYSMLTLAIFFLHSIFKLETLAFLKSKSV